jgi:hypothetical protein
MGGLFALCLVERGAGPWQDTQVRVTGPARYRAVWAPGKGDGTWRGG